MKSAKPLPKDVLGAAMAFLSGYALGAESELLLALKRIVEQSAFRNMVTPAGFRMSVAMTNCGGFGWVTDQHDYRYDPIDPETKQAWPEMPASFRELAVTAAAEAGFTNFLPDACLVNRCEPISP